MNKKITKNDRFVYFGFIFLRKKRVEIIDEVTEEDNKESSHGCLDFVQSDRCKKITHNHVLSVYDWFLITGVIASNIIYSVLSGNLDMVGSIAGIAGVLCVVLVAKGSIWNYLFGIINVSMYAYISYMFTRRPPILSTVFLFIIPLIVSLFTSFRQVANRR